MNSKRILPLTDIELAFIVDREFPESTSAVKFYIVLRLREVLELQRTLAPLLELPGAHRPPVREEGGR